ncbi:MAG: FtsQ-type POTRA domain-containing protein [Chloroflexi bacterium]|nr:FtsQ-type POTRA domain-containing protein [Chloroflexota bacterium]
MREPKILSAKRSFSLRSRNSERSQERVSQAADRARRPMAVPPVMARTSMAGKSAHRRPQGNARRQYYYSLNTPGAELRLPALPVVQFGWRLASGTMAVFLVIAIWALLSASNFQVEGVRVLGAKRLTSSDVNAALNIDGEPIVSVIPDQIKQDLLAAFPDILSADIEVGIPNAVVVRIIERKPVIAWQQDGKTQWIDAAGIVFPERGSAEGLVTVEAEGAPVIPGSEKSSAETISVVDQPALEPSEPKIFLPPEMIPSIIKLSKQAPAGMPIAFSPRYGLGWNDPQGWKVYFGMETNDVDLKLQQYQVIVQHLTSQGIHPVMISVEFPRAPFYRLEQ